MNAFENEVLRIKLSVREKSNWRIKTNYTMGMFIIVAVHRLLSRVFKSRR